ncbi:ABC transporter permease [Methylobacterium nigriterrae]|uniref:ABC transporter permease n=1 Tax=Methylobacterium nigriterrae TaxID=3127512 RepID=UPI003013F5F4
MRPGRLIRPGLAGLLLAFLAAPAAFAPLLAPLTENGAPAIYAQTPLWSLAAQHLLLVLAATAAASLVAVSLAILVTRKAGAEFLPLSRALADLGQTFPPVAVLALAVPLLGFGAVPTLVALFLYGLLPVFETALAGLTAIPPEVAEAARGMGLTERQRLRMVELPLAWPVILSGIRLSAVIALATATIGSTVAASTLGEVIVAGLLTGNTAFVLQGGLIVGTLAVLIDGGFRAAERRARLRLGLSDPPAGGP